MKLDKAFILLCTTRSLLWPFFAFLLFEICFSSLAGQVAGTILPIKFEDVTEFSGIEFVHSSGRRSSLLPEDMGSGAGFVDYDYDLDLDLYIVNTPGPLHAKVTSASARNVMYRNDGKGMFTDSTDQAGVGDLGYGMGCVFGDYDNDGHVDLYVTNYGSNVLYHNNGDGTFGDVTEKVGVGDERWSTGAVFGDYDNDGDLDLYVCNYVEYDSNRIGKMKEASIQAGRAVPSALNPVAFEPQDNVLYQNNGDGTFTDVSTALGVEAQGGRSLQAIFVDFDLDNDLDLYVANDLTSNFLYRNNGDGTFSDVSDTSWAADPRGSMGLAKGDYDEDGDLDLFISHWIDQENALYRNLRKEGEQIASESYHGIEKIRLVDESYGSLLADTSLQDIGWGTELFDYDNDGDLDIFVANGSTFQDLDRPESLIPQKDRLFRNDGSGVFTDVSQAVGISGLPALVGRGVAVGDYDNDGDIDIFIVNNNDRAVLLRNDGGNQNNWLQIKLIGTTGDRNAVGAKVRVKTADLIQVAEVSAGGSYMSFSSLMLEFGLGEETILDALEVVWLGGATQSFSGVLVNRQIVITQNRGLELHEWSRISKHDEPNVD